MRAAPHKPVPAPLRQHSIARLLHVHHLQPSPCVAAFFSFSPAPAPTAVAAPAAPFSFSPEPAPTAAPTAAALEAQAEKMVSVFPELPEAELLEAVQAAIKRQRG